MLLNDGPRLTVMYIVYMDKNKLSMPLYKGKSMDVQLRIQLHKLEYSLLT